MNERKNIVLVVEDDPLERLLACDLVSEAGLTPVEAIDAGEALRIMETRSDVGVVFTDIAMPGRINGVSLAERVQSRWPGVQVIVTSGLGPHAPHVGGFFLRKPYDATQFISLLRIVCSS